MKRVLELGKTAAIVVAASSLSSGANAQKLLGVWDSSWIEIASEDKTGSFNKVAPGYGGQDFDAEYLFYKFQGTNLSLGLQTGFDLIDGKLTHGGKDYYAGDLALSFDNNVILGDGSTYEYGIDFGLLTKDYDDDLVGGNSGTPGIDNAGLYQVTDWNLDVVNPGNSGGYDFTESNPLAMETGIFQTALIDNQVGREAATDVTASGKFSYWRIVTFDTSALPSGIDFSGIDVHWTMSCGNDAINGKISVVPLPAALPLFLSGLFGLGALMRRKRFSKSKVS